MKYLFYDDYSEGAHPEILEYMMAHNNDQQAGYGNDEYSLLAGKRIQEKLGITADVHLVSGGTQANLLAFASMLLPFQAVIAPATGHISTRETGAIEATGHKILVCETEDGKLTPALIQDILAQHAGGEHQVQPKVIYITQATELGTVYTKAELETLVAFAKEHDLYTYVDGARLAAALTAKQSKMSLAEFGALGIDMFYLGGNKNGALFGEAMVIANEKLRPNFRYLLKQRGALMAKGRVLGLQFARLFEDNLWLDLAQHSNDMTAALAQRLETIGVKLAYEQAANQIFPILPNNVIDKIKQDYGFHMWKPEGTDHSIIRLVCSYATQEEALDIFVADLKHSLDTSQTDHSA